MSNKRWLLLSVERHCSHYIYMMIVCVLFTSTL